LIFALTNFGIDGVVVAEVNLALNWAERDFSVGLIAVVTLLVVGFAPVPCLGPPPGVPPPLLFIGIYHKENERISQLDKFTKR
jgi:hypothetical protein